MPIYEYKCTNEECGEVVEHFFDMDKRKKAVKCEKCGSKAGRLYSSIEGYVKRTYVGDVWEKRNIEPVSDKNPKAKKANIKRVEKIREDKASRIDMARKKRQREGKE